MGQAGHEGPARVAAHFYQELVALRPHELGQGQVEAGGRPRSGVHGGAKAGAPGLGAVHRHHEDAPSATLVVRVHVGALQEHLVLDANGRKLARPDADEGQRRGLFLGVEHLEPGAPPLGAPEHERSWVKELLPGVGRDGVAEERLVVPARQPVPSGFLFVRPAFGQVADRADVVVDDRAVAEGGPQVSIAALAQPGQERIEARPVQDGEITNLHRRPRR